MSKATFADFTPANSVFARILAVIEGFLTKSAKISQKNGDLPYFGL